SSKSASSRQARAGGVAISSLGQHGEKITRHDHARRRNNQPRYQPPQASRRSRHRGAAVVAASLVESGDARAAPVSSRSPDPAATPPVAGLHLQFGADASSEMVVSWHSLQPVQNPRVVLGHLDGKLEQTVKARATNYTDAKSGQRVYAHHAKLTGL